MTILFPCVLAWPGKSWAIELVIWQELLVRKNIVVKVATFMQCV